MIWTKLKHTAEALLAESLSGRIAYHITRYGPGMSAMMNRGWISFNQHEIASFSTMQQMRTNYHVTGSWYRHDPQEYSTLDHAGVFTRDDFVDALEGYVQLPIAEALHAPTPLMRAVAMFDYWLGKRRLRTLVLRASEHPLVIQCFQVRCEVEGISIDRNRV